MLVEVVGGILSGSLALLADAGHMLTDAAALLFRAAGRPVFPSPAHNTTHLRLAEAHDARRIC